MQLDPVPSKVEDRSRALAQLGNECIDRLLHRLAILQVVPTRRGKTEITERRADFARILHSVAKRRQVEVGAIAEHQRLARGIGAFRRSSGFMNRGWDDRPLGERPGRRQDLEPGRLRLHEAAEKPENRPFQPAPKRAHLPPICNGRSKFCGPAASCVKVLRTPELLVPTLNPPCAPAPRCGSPSACCAWC